MGGGDRVQREREINRRRIFKGYTLRTAANIRLSVIGCGCGGIGIRQRQSESEDQGGGVADYILNS